VNRKFISNSNYVFRKILNSEDCLGILKNFIESILNINIKKIELNPYLKHKENYLPKEENFGIADVRIKTDENEELNVGIQFIDGIYVQTKMLMYYSQIHLNQLEYGDNREFARTITINLIDFRYFSSKGCEKTIKIKANDFTLPQTPAETYQKFAQSRTITRGNANYSVKMVNADDIPDLHAFTHAPDVGYITGGSRDANFANFDFFKLANDDKIICTCYVSNDHYGPVKQFKNGFIFDVDNTKQYVGYGTDIWSIGKNIPDIVIEYFRDRGLASAKNRGAKFEQRAYISEQLKALLYPEDTSFSGKVKKWTNNLFKTEQGLSKSDLEYIQRLENIKTRLGSKPFTIQNIETIDSEFAQAYRTFLNSDNSILVDSYHNEVLVSNPKITAIFTSDIDKIPEEYLIKAQEEDLPIIVFKTED